jgi:hypothetical protein
MRVYKVDMDSVRESGLNLPENIAALQTAVYVACGGGLLGEMAATQPADFYIDLRCGKLPYPKRAILQAVEVLATLATVAGLDPHHMPAHPRFHASGVF